MKKLILLVATTFAISGCTVVGLFADAQLCEYQQNREEKYPNYYDEEQDYCDLTFTSLGLATDLYIISNAFNPDINEK